MSFANATELGQQLVRLRLITPEQFDDALAHLPPTRHGADDLISVLEGRHVLTSFQANRLRKHEIDGLVLGEYKLLYQNASGSFARVYRAAHIRNGQMIGLKLLRQRWAKDSDTVSQFHREAQLCRSLKHKNIVPIYDIGSEGQHHFFTMEFVEGGNLRDFLRIRGKLSPAEATRCALDMAEGLEYALAKRITHRDLKLTNVLMSTEGTAKLVDFGLAGADGSSDDIQHALEYSTLERGTGATLNDPRSDLFFLGAIFYELLIGEPPWKRTRDRQERKRLERYTTVTPLDVVDPTLPNSIVEIVQKLMRASPQQRYQTHTELIGDLRVALRELGETVQLPAGPARVDSESGKSVRTVMCIDSRAKQQDMLRQYLAKHGYRPLVLSDPERALGRLRTNPPDGIVLMGEPIGDRIVGVYNEAVELADALPVLIIAVLSAKQDHLKQEMPESPRAQVLLQPITLRDLRRAIRIGFHHIHADSGEYRTHSVEVPS